MEGAPVAWVFEVVRESCGGGGKVGIDGVYINWI